MSTETVTPRYTYDHCTNGSWHDGGLGSTNDLKAAIAQAAQIQGLGAECWASVYDEVTGDSISWVSTRYNSAILKNKSASHYLRKEAKEKGWIK